MALNWITEPIDQSLTVGDTLGVSAEVGGVDFPQFDLLDFSPFDPPMNIVVTQTSISGDISQVGLIPRSTYDIACKGYDIDFVMVSSTGSKNIQYRFNYINGTSFENYGFGITLLLGNQISVWLEDGIDTAPISYNWQNKNLIVSIRLRGQSQSTLTISDQLTGIILSHSSSYTFPENITGIENWFDGITGANFSITEYSISPVIEYSYTLTKDAQQIDQLTTTDTTYNFSKTADLSDTSANWNLQAISGGEEINSPFTVDVQSLRWITEPSDRSLTVGDTLGVSAEVGGFDTDGFSKNIRPITDDCWGNRVVNEDGSITFTGTTTPYGGIYLGDNTIVNSYVKVLYSTMNTDIGWVPSQNESFRSAVYAYAGVLKSPSFSFQSVYRAEYEVPFEIEFIGFKDGTAIIRTLYDEWVLSFDFKQYFLCSRNTILYREVREDLIQLTYNLTKDSVLQDSITTADTTYNFSKTAGLEDYGDWNLQAVSGGEEINSPFVVEVSDIPRFIPIDEISQGDPKMFVSPDGMTLKFVGGVPVMDSGLENVATISLGTLVGYSLNKVASNGGESVGSSFISESLKSITRDQIRVLEDAAEKSFQWAIDDGLILSADATIGIGEHSRGYEMTLVLTPPTGENRILVYNKNGENWINQKWSE